MHVWVVIRVERLISVSLASGLLKAPGWDASSILVTLYPQSVFSGGLGANGKSLSGYMSHKYLFFTYYPNLQVRLDGCFPV